MNARRSLRIAGIALGLLASTGCGEDPGIQKGTVEFKGSPPEGLDSMAKEMQKNMQNRSYLKEKEANEAAKPADASKEAAETKPAAKSASEAETKPAAEAKSATKGE
jgi:hypothetical protein